MAAGLAAILPGWTEAPAPDSTALCASSGQIAPSPYKVGYYAAARFADQATFGPTPTLIDELRTKGFEQWIEDQFKLPYTPFPPGTTRVRDRSAPAPTEVVAWLSGAWLDQAIAEPGQLRRRTAWLIGSYLVATYVQTRMELQGGPR
jgi:hypothetical protein